jgi:hypothetical protein
MGKGGSKIGAVNVGLPCALWEEKPMTAGTEYIYSVVPRKIRQSYWKHRLTLAKHMWTSPKGSRTILFIHGVHSSIRNNIPSVNKSIQHFLWAISMIAKYLCECTHHRCAAHSPTSPSFHLQPQTRQFLVVPISSECQKNQPDKVSLIYTHIRHT